MSIFQLIFFIWVLLSSSFSLLIGSFSWCPNHHAFHRESPQKFEQKTDRFWEFNEKTNTWVEVKLPYDLVTCVNDNCTKVGSIGRTSNPREAKETEDDVQEKKETPSEEGKFEGLALPLRKRVSLTKMSETSIWVTGESGSIYERFWNGVQWVIAPHDLPIPVEHAISVFIVNHTILALSETGNLYQVVTILQLLHRYLSQYNLL